MRFRSATAQPRFLALELNSLKYSGPTGMSTPDSRRRIRAGRAYVAIFAMYAAFHVTGRAYAGGAYIPQFGMYAITEQGPWAAVKHLSENRTSSLISQRGTRPATPVQIKSRRHGKRRHVCATRERDIPHPCHLRRSLPSGDSAQSWLRSQLMISPALANARPWRGWRRRLLYSVCVVPKGWSCSTEKRIVQADGAPQASIHCWRTTIHHVKRVSPDAGVSF